MTAAFGHAKFKFAVHGMRARRTGGESDSGRSGHEARRSRGRRLRRRRNARVRERAGRSLLWPQTLSGIPSERQDRRRLRRNRRLFRGGGLGGALRGGHRPHIHAQHRLPGLLDSLFRDLSSPPDREVDARNSREVIRFGRPYLAGSRSSARQLSPRRSLRNLRAANWRRRSCGCGASSRMSPPGEYELQRELNKLDGDGCRSAVG